MSGRYILAIALLCVVSISSVEYVPTAYAQEQIVVPSSTPCFMNYTSPLNMWENCGAGEDYISFALAPFEWVTGGHFSMILVSIFVLFTYIKYQKVVYPIMIGVMFLPISYFVFPEEFISWALIMTGVTLGILIWYVYIKQTKEY